jgi:hypothetical protein
MRTGRPNPSRSPSLRAPVGRCGEAHRAAQPGTLEYRSCMLLALHSLHCTNKIPMGQVQPVAASNPRSRAPCHPCSTIMMVSVAAIRGKSADP